MGPSVSRDLWTRPVARAAVGMHECTQIGENGLSAPFWGICVHYCDARRQDINPHQPTKSLFFALIFVGYASVSSTQAPSYIVTCFGLPIYEITSSSNGPVGQAVGANMSIIGMACTLGMGLVVELVLAVRAKDK